MVSRLWSFPVPTVSIGSLKIVHTSNHSTRLQLYICTLYVFIASVVTKVYLHLYKIYTIRRPRSVMQSLLLSCLGRNACPCHVRVTMQTDASFHLLYVTQETYNIIPATYDELGWYNAVLAMCEIMLGNSAPSFMWQNNNCEQYIRAIAA